MSSTSITNKKSIIQAMTRSTGQARNRIFASAPSVYQVIHGQVPLCGFGTFHASSIYGSFVYNEVWPFVYAKMVETWTQSNGNGQIKTTTYSQYADIGTTVSTTVIGSGQSYSSTTSVSVTSTLVTVNYNAGGAVTGTYTAQLSGSLLNPAGSGPFDPADATYGWAAMVAAASACCAAQSFPATGWVEVWTPKSTGGYYRTSASDDSHGTIIQLFIAANGVGMRTQPVPWGTSMGTDYPFSQNIGSNPFPWTTPFYKNSGAICCTKSIWTLNGQPPSVLAFYNPNKLTDFTVINSQPLDLNVTTSAPEFGTIYPATTIETPSHGPLQNPVSIGSTITFVPDDIIVNNSNQGLSTDWGMLGFRFDAV